MGMEARCRAHYGGRISEGKAHLEDDSLVFRGDFRVQIPLREVRVARSSGADLHVEWGAESLVLEMGPDASRWAEKISHPPARTDKLGIKEDQRVVLLGHFDDSFAEELRSAGARVGKRLSAESDIIFLGVAERGDLTKAADLRTSLRGSGAVWIVYPKGQKTITQNDVFEAGRGAGLVDVKVAGFSPTHTALKFVVPVHKREKK